MAATAGGGLVGVVVLATSGDYAGAAIAAAVAVPGLLHGLVVAGGLRGVARALWSGR